MYVTINSERRSQMRGSMKTKIIFEDKHVLVIQKPAGLATQTARVDQQDVVSELKNYLAGPAYLGIVHRLDQPVEGLLVFGKNKAATASLTAQLGQHDKDGMMNKRYYCVICGKAPVKEGRLVDYLYKDVSVTGNAIVLSADSAKQDSRAKLASLHYRILQEKEIVIDKKGAGQMADRPSSIWLSLADVQIDTGRYHQIRAQMSHSGMCLLGDGRYGDDHARNISDLLGIRGASLCAYSLEFVHPVSKKKLSFQVKPQGPGFSYFSF